MSKRKPYNATAMAYGEQKVAIIGNLRFKEELSICKLKYTVIKQLYFSNRHKKRQFSLPL